MGVSWRSSVNGFAPILTVFVFEAVSEGVGTTFLEGSPVEGFFLKIIVPLRG